MLIKLLRQIACADGVFRDGEEANIDDSVAKGLVDAGYAISLEIKAEPAREKIEEVETSEAEPAREIAATVKQSRKRLK